jgi:hypothetical protein
MNYSLRLNIDSVSTNNKRNYRYSHAVCRSAELLSCAKTAVKIAQSRKPQNATNGKPNNGSDWIGNLNLSDLELYNHKKQRKNSPLIETVDDGLEILDGMESELHRLNELVRRRGHSNDPTQEISASVALIENDVAELTSIVQTMVSRGSAGQQQNQQRQRHIKVIQEWFQIMTQHYAAQLKDVLSVRATVLAEQARRRGMFQPNVNATTNTAATSTISTAYSNTNTNSSNTSAAQNALFAPLPARSKPQNLYSPYQQGSILRNGESHQAIKGALASNSTSNGTGGYGGGGYGGNYYTQANGIESDSTTSETGMRRRKQQYSTTETAGDNLLENSPEVRQQQQQQQFAVLEQQQQNRQTAARLKEARQAEQSLAALGTIFGKMSTLIVQQSETLNKIEDDVEAANVDVNAGHSEITTLYSIKKGNRMLIIKVYSLLIFLIVFMRFYVKK